MGIEEAIFNFMNVLLAPGDHMVVQALRELAAFMGYTTICNSGGPAEWTSSAGTQPRHHARQPDTTRRLLRRTRGSLRLASVEGRLHRVPWSATRGCGGVLCGPCRQVGSAVAARNAVRRWLSRISHRVRPPEYAGSAGEVRRVPDRYEGRPTRTREAPAQWSGLRSARCSLSHRESTAHLGRARPTSFPYHRVRA